MSKSSQRQASEKSRREAEQKQKRNRKLMVPVVGSGVILQRNHKHSLAEISAKFGLDSPYFKQETKKWLAGDNEFFVYVLRNDGRAMSWDISSESVLVSCVDQIHAEFEARRCTCIWATFITDPALTESLNEKAEEHILASSESASIHDENIKGVDLLSPPSSHHVFGRVLIVNVAKSTVVSQIIYGFLRILDALVVNTDAIEGNWMNLRLAFDGYDDDPREVFEIPEIRSFLAAVMKNAPWWVGLVSPSEYSTWFGCVATMPSVRYSNNREIKIQFHPNEIELLLPQIINGAGTLLRCSGMDEGHAKQTLVENLSLALVQLVQGINQTALDPLVISALKD